MWAFRFSPADEEGIATHQHRSCGGGQWLEGRPDEERIALIYESAGACPSLQ
jgi:hypothetical protein